MANTIQVEFNPLDITLYFTNIFVDGVGTAAKKIVVIPCSFKTIDATNNTSSSFNYTVGPRTLSVSASKAATTKNTTVIAKYASSATVVDKMVIKVVPNATTTANYDVVIDAEHEESGVVTKTRRYTNLNITDTAVEDLEVTANFEKLIAVEALANAVFSAS